MDWMVIIQSALGSFFGGMGVVIICRLFLWGWLGINKVAKVTKPMDGTEGNVQTCMIQQIKDILTVSEKVE